MGAIAWLLLGLLSLGVAALWLVAYQLARRQAWLLLRLERVETRLGATPPRGLDLRGADIGLDDYRGRRVLLVHWDPQCSFCRRIVPDLAGLRAGFKEHKTELVLVSSRDADGSRTLAAEHGLECSILGRREREPIAAFAGLGTPAAYLLDEDGRVATPLALGAEEVVELAREAVGRRSLAGSRIERRGIVRGLQAPAFELPDLRGERVALEDYRGRPVLLVFSDPGCGPCTALAAELARFHRERGNDGLAVLMVSRGALEDNRRKAAEQGIEFPVVIQRGWRLSREYGIFETPVAFLVDERGVIAHDVARGREEIMRLAREGLQARAEVRWNDRAEPAAFNR